MIALLIVAACLSGWALSYALYLEQDKRSFGRIDGETAFATAVLSSMTWPLTLVPQIVLRYARRERKARVAGTSRKERRLLKQTEQKRRELVAAQKVKALQDEIDQITFS